MFGGRRSRNQAEEDLLKIINLPQLPGALETTAQLPALPPVSGLFTSHPPALPAEPASAAALTEAAEHELLEKVAAFRSAVADQLYEISNDYRILCNVAHADLKSCDQIIDELRERLAASAHYQVLAKLDEAHVLTETHMARDPR